MTASFLGAQNEIYIDGAAKAVNAKQQQNITTHKQTKITKVGRHSSECLAICHSAS